MIVLLILAAHAGLPWSVTTLGFYPQLLEMELVINHWECDQQLQI